MVSTTAKQPSPYTAFAKILSSYHEQYAEAGPSSAQLDAPIRVDAVLDEEAGMIAALAGSLEEALRASSSGSSDHDLTKEQQDALLLEHRTWLLLRSIFDNLQHRADPSFTAPSAAQQLRDNPYTTPEELTQLIVNEDPELSLWATLVEHLQSRALFSSPPPLEARHGYLPSTVRRIKAARLNSTAGATASASVPSSIDPDFTLRDPHGAGLAGEDQTYHGPLLETLWDLIRHGEMDQALKVCEEGGEPWRAASLMGGRRWSMSGLTEEGMALGALEGNRTRGLWKKSCRAIAKNPTLSAPERHLYAALISDLPTLLPACDTWEDNLWAHVQHRIEVRIEQRWHELGGFWEIEDRLVGRDNEAGVELGRGGLDEIFASIAASSKDAVVRASQDPYYVAQKMILLGQTDTLLETFANRLGGLENSVEPTLIGPLLRFFTHLVLVLRTVGQGVPDAAANAIIEAYLRILEQEGNDSLVAMYAACLREGSGEESYARFLRSMDSNATREAKQEALLRAKQHNLDVAVIAKETVRLILEEAFATIPSLVPGQPDITSFATGLSERDVYLIRSIEWLTMVPETMDEALIKSNAVTRYFLALGQVDAAQGLLKTLPAEIAQTSDEEDDVEDDYQSEEHDQLRRLFTVYACHELVDEVLSRAPKATASKVDQHNWKKRLETVVDQTYNETVNILTSNWLRFEVSTAVTGGSQRRKELQRIRQIFVPELVLRLHNRLMESRTYFPKLLQRALDLTKIVAAEENHVYEEFFGREGTPYRLVAYLDKMRETSMAVLEAGSEDPFKAKA